MSKAVDIKMANNLELSILCSPVAPFLSRPLHTEIPEYSHSQAPSSCRLEGAPLRPPPPGLPASRGLQLQGSGPPSAGGTSAPACSPGPGRCGGRSGGSAAGRGGGWGAGVGGRARGGSSGLGEVGGCEGSEEEQNRQPAIYGRKSR